MAETSIEWTEQTWNPIVGCSVVSPGCTNCYAMKMAARLEAMGTPRYAGLTKPSKAGAVWTGKMRLVDEALTIPLRRRKPTTYFVNSMSDLFHESVPYEWIDRVFAVMALAPQHTFQVLTKRSARMRKYLSRPHAPGKFITIADDGSRSDTPAAEVRVHSAVCDLFGKAPARALNDAIDWQDRHHPGGDGFMRRWPLPNVWLGVSAEDQRRADERVPDLLATPAAVHFVSAEPLLGPIDFEAMPFAEGDQRHRWSALTGQAIMYATGENGHPDFTVRLEKPIKSRLDWIIVGGESGPNARPMHPAWARSIRDQCAAAGVAFHFKQWGAFHPADQTKSVEQIRAGGDMGHALRDGRAHAFEDQWTWRLGKKLSGRLLDGVEHNGFPSLAPLAAE